MSDEQELEPEQGQGHEREQERGHERDKKRGHERDKKQGHEPEQERGPGREPDRKQTHGREGREPEQAREEGPDAVRAALNRARSAARAKGLRPGAPPSDGTAPARRARAADAARRSGAHPDARDPQVLGSTMARLVAERGWEAPVAVGGVFGRWDAVVGAEIAAHCTPETFEDGVLAVRADSTAWATQLRLFVPTLMRRLAEELGERTVTKVVVRAPTAPSWRRGPRVAPGGSGPRDTYG